MSITEVLGFVTGALCVLLAVREHVWNWPVGMANNIFFLVLFWHSKLYADGSLQVIYLLIAIYGWWLWLFGGESRSELTVSETGTKDAALLAVAAIALTLAIYYVLRTFTDSTVPMGDALTTGLSLVAQYMLGRKLIENRAVWITADVIYIALYWYKHLYLTSGLYAIFICMCVVGYSQWRRSLKAGVTGRAAEA
jgi:nicotinamide mononucleotide transporter